MIKRTMVMAVLAGVVGTSAAEALASPTVLFVVNNSSSLEAQESAKRTLMQGWGYIVTPISASASQAAFDAALRAASCVYISETVLSGDVGTKLTGTVVGIVCEESSLSDELGISASMSTITDSQMNVINTTHYITSGLSSGTNTLFSASQPVRFLSGSLGGFTVLGQRVGGTEPVMVVMEPGATLTPSGTAAGRRVYLPWGNTGMNINQLNTAGQTIMRRSIEWVLLPISHWKLDETSGTTAADWVGGRNGTLSGATWASGRVAGGVQLNGTSNFVSVPDSAAFRVTTAMTICGWIRASSWPNDGNWASVILRKGDANPNNWQLAVREGRVIMTLDEFDLYSVGGSVSLATNKWNHVAGTWDGTQIRLYVNGVADGSPVSRAAPIGTDTRPVYIGGRNGMTDITNGTVDDVRFYNRALTADEIADLAKVAPTLTTWKAVTPP